MVEWREGRRGQMRHNTFQETQHVERPRWAFLTECVVLEIWRLAAVSIDQSTYPFDIRRDFYLSGNILLLCLGLVTPWRERDRQTGTGESLVWWHNNRQQTTPLSSREMGTHSPRGREMHKFILLIKKIADCRQVLEKDITQRHQVIGENDRLDVFLQLWRKEFR